MDTLPKLYRQFLRVIDSVRESEQETIKRKREAIRIKEKMKALEVSQEENCMRGCASIDNTSRDEKAN